jgi:glycosyltransferase involved in cell wall biosynthesis
MYQDDMRGPTPSRTKTAQAYSLPLVSVVVINFNYGMFLKEAVESVLTQSYPCIECLIVNDCSTDDSAEIIERLREEYGSIKVLTNEANLGQSVSAQRGLKESSGDYVIFMDADDFMLARCIEAHVIAHLSLRVPVGFTSVDMLQIFEGRVVTTAFPCFAEFVQTRSQTTSEHVRYLDISSYLPQPILAREQIHRLVHYVHPKESGGWPWSPMSGNCYRRDALQLVIDNDELANLKTATDCYLQRGVSSLTGSALIDMPLVGYRRHASNDFVRSGNLHRIVSYDKAILTDRSNKAMIILIDFMVDRAATLVDRLESPQYFQDALDAFDRVYPPIGDGKSSYISQKLLQNGKGLRAALGASRYDFWLATRLVPASIQAIPLIGRIATSFVKIFWVPRLAK